MGLLARFRSSLAYPIAATLVLVTVVPVVVVGLQLSASHQEHLTTTEKINLTRQATSLASEASLFFAAHRTQLDSTALALGAGAAVEAGRYPTLLEGMSEVRDHAFIYLRILNREGQGSFVRAPRLDSGAEQALTALLQEVHTTALGGVKVEHLNVPMPGRRAPVAVFSLPVRSQTGEVWGTLDGVLDLGQLERRLTDDTYAGLRVCVIDSVGRVVLAREAKSRGADLSRLPLVQDFRRSAQRLTRIYTDPDDPSLGEMLGSAAPISDLGWGVVVERPTAEAFAIVRLMQQRTLLITGLAALLALATGFAMSRRVIYPLQNLAGVTTQIADGDLAVRANVSGDHEIARLAANFNHMAGSVEALVRRLRQALRQNQELFLDTIRTLAAAIDAKDPYTRGHSERVSSYSMAVAKHLGLSQDEVFRIRIAAILHDVGKLGIRDGILNKPGILTDDEFAVMRRHPDIGAQIMSPIRMLKDIIPGIRNHHESWDGRGYPDRMRGDQIPLVARIIGIADTFDAMTTNRPYQAAMSLDLVLDRMRSLAGNRFDPDVIEAFLAAVSSGDITPPAVEPVEPAERKEVS
jgi:HD-GYP domain-containing protein (c-di-GMP phosphodiesterase class II)